MPLPAVLIIGNVRASVVDALEAVRATRDRFDQVNGHRPGVPNPGNVQGEFEALAVCHGLVRTVPLTAASVHTEAEFRLLTRTNGHPMIRALREFERDLESR